MPIDASSLDEKPEELLSVEEGSQPYRILQFLARHHDTAFTQSEIAAETGIRRGSVGAALSRLDDRGLLRHGGRYWAIADDEQLVSVLSRGSAKSVTAHRRAAEAFAKRAGDRHGEAVESIAVFGSVARGEERGRDSDVDLLVVLRDAATRETTEEDLRALAYDVELEYGVPLSLVFKTSSEFDRERDRPFLRTVTREARVLYG